MAIIAREEREKKEADAARLAKEAKKKALKSKLDGDKNMDMGALEQVGGTSCVESSAHASDWDAR